MQKLKREQLPDVAAPQRLIRQGQFAHQMPAPGAVIKQDALQDVADADDDQHGHRDGLSGSKHRLFHVGTVFEHRLPTYLLTVSLSTRFAVSGLLPNVYLTATGLPG